MMPNIIYILSKVPLARSLRFLLFAVVAVAFVLLVGCKKVLPIKSTGISIHTGNEAISSADNFSQLFKSFQSEESILYVPLGAEIVVEFEDAAPEQAILVDQLLNNTGGLRYQADVQNEHNLTAEGHELSFHLKKNWATSLSSDSKDYEPGKTIRGFTLTYDDHGDEKILCFALCTDAEGEADMW